MSLELAVAGGAMVLVTGLITLVWIGLRRITSKMFLVASVVIGAIALLVLALGGLASSVSTNAAATAAATAHTASSTATTVVGASLFLVICIGAPVLALALAGAVALGRWWGQGDLGARSIRQVDRRARRKTLPATQPHAPLIAPPQQYVVIDPTYTHSMHPPLPPGGSHLWGWDVPVEKSEDTEF